MNNEIKLPEGEFTFDVAYECNNTDTLWKKIQVKANIADLVKKGKITSRYDENQTIGMPTLIMMKVNL